MDLAGSSGIGCSTNLPLIKGLLKNPRISGTGERLIFTNSATQSMMARISMAALSAPGPKNRKEWISGWCSSGRIWCWRSSKYSMGLSTIFLHHFSCSLRAINLAPKLSSDSTLKSSGQTSGHAFRIPGRNDQNFWSAIYCGHQNGVGTYLAMANRPWRNHHICFGQPGRGLPNLQVSASSGGPTLRQTSTSAEMSEPPAHLEVKIEPCLTADSQLGKRPRRV